MHAACLPRAPRPARSLANRRYCNARDGATPLERRLATTPTRSSPPASSPPASRSAPPPNVARIEAKPWSTPRIALGPSIRRSVAHSSRVPRIAGQAPRERFKRAARCGRQKTTERQANGSATRRQQHPEKRRPLSTPRAYRLDWQKIRRGQKRSRGLEGRALPAIMDVTQPSRSAPGRHGDDRPARSTRRAPLAQRRQLEASWAMDTGGTTRARVLQDGRGPFGVLLVASGPPSGRRAGAQRPIFECPTCRR